MNIYFPIIKALLDYKNYSKFRIDLEYIDDPAMRKLFRCLPKLHESGKDKIYTPLDFKLAVLSEYPNFDSEILNNSVQAIAEDTTDPDIIINYIDSLSLRHHAMGVARRAIEVAEGRKDFDYLKEVTSRINPSTKDTRRGLVEMDLSKLLEKQNKSKLLRWRLNSLNKNLGPLRKGDFGFIFARPETGKTTFLASECTRFAEQIEENEGPILWFNNEEQGDKVVIRCYQAAFKKNLGTIIDPVSATAEFMELTHGKLLVYDLKPMHKNEVEAICQEHSPSLIIFDQIDKVVGFDADRLDMELKQVYSWARELASQYGPVIGVCQAGASGDGKQWLTMNDVDNSKTAKQGEADWILGIGKVFDFEKENVRYFNLSKNKLMSVEEGGMRHGHWSVMIDPDKVRYYDFDNNGRIEE